MNQTSLNHGHIDPNHIKQSDIKQAETAVTRRSVQSYNAEALADVYQDDVNIATWQRTLSPNLLSAVQQLLSSDHLFRISTSVTPHNTYDSLYDALGSSDHAQVISEDITEIVDMFCCLFDLKQVGLRLTTLDRAMCPKFHVDRVPCRLVTTYSGIATEWLPHEFVDRQKLGVGSQGKSDEESGLYQHQSDIRRLSTGDVALLKGESWLGNEGAGLVHRSPALANKENRLLLTLDFN